MVHVAFEPGTMGKLENGWSGFRIDEPSKAAEPCGELHYHGVMRWHIHVCCCINWCTSLHQHRSAFSWEPVMCSVQRFRYTNAHHTYRMGNVNAKEAPIDRKTGKWTRSHRSKVHRLSEIINFARQLGRILRENGISSSALRNIDRLCKIFPTIIYRVFYLYTVIEFRNCAIDFIEMCSYSVKYDSVYKKSIFS